MRNWPRYIARKIDRWQWGFMRLGEPRSRQDGTCWIDVAVNKHDWRYKVLLAWLWLRLLFKEIRVDMTIANRWTLPVWGWWNDVG